MKAVLLSIRPKWCDLIASGEKTIEVRKTRPHLETPFKCYIYCTGVKSMNLRDYVVAHQATGGAVDDWSGKVVGEFVCDNVEVLFNTNGNPENYMTEILPSILQKTALSYDEFGAYVGSRAGKNSIYGWHVSDLKVYDKPRELSEFAVADKEAIRQCEYREFYCKKKDDWCFGECKRKALTRPPQSYMYVEDLQ